MHLVLINQYYPPDVAPTGQMLITVAEALATGGHQITVLCSKGGYARVPEANGPGSAIPVPGHGKVRLIRVGSTGFGRTTVAGKLIDYASFYGAVCARLLTLQPRPDRIVALTTPPLLSVPARLLSKLRGADHAHWVMDLYPDVMVAHGMLRENSLLHRVLGGLARWGFGGKRSAAVVTLGPDMADRVQRWLPRELVASSIPLWSTSRPASVAPGSGPQPGEAPGPVSRESRGWRPEELVLMYSGNMGLGHRFSEFLEAAQSLSGEAVRFVFTGGGRRRREIEVFRENHPDAPLELHDYVPEDKLAAHLLAADVHLASLEPAWDGTMVPSKLQGIFSAGRPVIFVGSSTCSIGRWIEESGGGWVVEPGNQAALLEAIRSAQDPAERQNRGEAARRFASSHFSCAGNAADVAALLSAPPIPSSRPLAPPLPGRA